jgi:hypothetical protein
MLQIVDPSLLRTKQKDKGDAGKDRKLAKRITGTIRGLSSGRSHGKTSMASRFSVNYSDKKLLRKI